MNSKKIGIPLIVALLMVVSMVLTGCGSGKQAGTQPQIAFYAYNSEPILDWDPSVEFSNGIVVLNNVYETLMKYDPLQDQFQPLLATEYKKSADGLVWTFKLREGVKFHDGTEMNAQAVKFSIDRTIKLQKGAAYIWSAVKEIKIVDNNTVEFDLSYPAPIDLVSSSGYSAFIVSPKAVQSHPDEWLSQGHEAGTGPYMLQSYKMGEEVVLTAFKDYWKGWEGKHFDKVVIKKIPEAVSRRQLVEKGEADITFNLPSEDIQSLTNNSKVNIVEGPSFQNLFFLFNCQKAPFNNKLVRQAMSYAFPYQDVVKYAMGGLASQAKGAIPTGMWGHGDNLTQYTTDLAKAKQLLAQAGYPNGGFKLLLTYMSGDEDERKSAELFKSQLAKLNINLEVRAMPWESQWELSKSKDPNQRQDIMAMYWWPDFASPYSWFFNLYHSEKDIMYNLAYWYNGSFDKVVDKANEISGINRQQAEQMYIDAQKIIVDEAPAIFAFDKKNVFITSKSFKGFQDNPIYPNVVFFYDTHRE